MSTYSSDITNACRNCSAPLSPTAKVCESCRTLVHADAMEQAAAQARATETRGDLELARQQWLAVLPLLPADSKQAEWIRSHAQELEKTAYEAHRPKDPNEKNKWAKRLGPLGPIAIVLAKFKTFFFALFKLKFLFSFAAFIGLYWAMWGPKFGIGFAVLILIHEMGHYIEVKRRGLPAEMPVFLPGLGAYVKWTNLGVTLETRAAISLAGPLAGLLASAACALIFFQTHDPIWAALAKSGAWLNALNLIPIWVLDGAGAILPLSGAEKLVIAVVAAGLGYGTQQGVFYFVAAGTVFNLVVVGLARAPIGGPIVRLDLSNPGQASATQYAPPQQPVQQSSALIAAYFIAVLAALGVLLYLLRDYGIKP